MLAGISLQPGGLDARNPAFVQGRMGRADQAEKLGTFDAPLQHAMLGLPD
jgi:hypothetical protein